MHMYHTVAFQKQWLFMYTISISIDQEREQLICITKMTSSMLTLSSYFTLWSIKKMVCMHFYNINSIYTSTSSSSFAVREKWQISLTKKRTETFKFKQRIYPIDHSRKKDEWHVIAEKKNIPDKPSHNFII